MNGQMAKQIRREVKEYCKAVGIPYTKRLYCRVKKDYTRKVG